MKAEYDVAKQAELVLEEKKFKVFISILTKVLEKKHMISNEFFFGPEFKEACKKAGLSIDHKRLESGQLLIGGPHVVYAYIALQVEWPFPL